MFTGFRSPFPVSDPRMNKTLSYLAPERTRIVGREREQLADGDYRVLATLLYGERSYRVFADLCVENGSAELRLHRFDHVSGDEWFVERKVTLHVAQPELLPLPQKVNGTDFQLCAPLRLDETKAAVVFGPAGPPAM